MRMAWVVLAWVGLAGCFYSPEKLAADLRQGDVRGVTVGVPPGETARKNLEGARARLLGSSVVRTTRADGSFVLRNLPAGSHRVELSWRADPASTQDALVARLEVPIRVHPVSGARAALDLGTVLLLEPGTITGSVDVSAIPGLTAEAVVVAVLDSDLRVTPDAQGRFTVRGLGAGPWQLVAAAPGALSSVGAATVTPAQTTQLTAPLRLAVAQGTGSLQGELLEETPAVPLSGGASPLRAPVVMDLVPLAAALDPAAVEVAQQFVQTAPVGLFSAVFTAPGVYEPILISNVLVLPDGSRDMGPVLLRTGPTSGCVDRDDDGACHATTWSPACVMLCRGVNGVAAHCEDNGTVVDCDDDADGQVDVDEAQGPPQPGPGQLAGACRCGNVPGTQDGPLCDGDPTRSDRDFDGVCDAFDQAPDCPAGAPQCGGSTLPDGGVMDGGNGGDAGLNDAGTGDAGLDGGAADAGGQDAGAMVDAGPSPVPFGRAISGVGARPLRMAVLPNGHVVMVLRNGGPAPTQSAFDPAMPAPSTGYTVALFDPAGVCQHAWHVDPGNVDGTEPVGLDLDDQSRVLVVSQHTNSLSLANPGANYTAQHAVGGFFLHVWRMNPSNPFAAPDLYVTPHARPAFQGVRFEPSTGDTLVYGSSIPNLDLLIESFVFPAQMDPAGFAIRLSPAFAFTNARYFAGSIGAAGVLGSVVLASGDVELVGYAQSEVTARDTPPTTLATIPSDPGNNLWVWQEPGGSPMPGVLPVVVDNWLGGLPELMEARHQGTLLDVVLRMDTVDQRQDRVLVPGALALDTFGPVTLAWLRLDGANLVHARALSLGSQTKGFSSPQSALLDSAGDLWVGGLAEEGLIVTDVTAATRTLSNMGNGGFVARLATNGDVAATFIQPPVATAISAVTALAKTPPGQVLASGYATAASMTLGVAANCVTTAPAPDMQAVDPAGSTWWWEVGSARVPTQCALAAPLSVDTVEGRPEIAPQLTLDGSGNGAGSVTLDADSDVDCFSFPAPRYGNYQWTVGSGVCSSVLEYSLVNVAGGIEVQLQRNTPPACPQFNTFLNSGTNYALCVSAVGGVPTGPFPLAAVGTIPANDACANAEPVGAPADGSGGFLLLAGTNFNSVEEPGWQTACGTTTNLGDVYYALQGQPGNVDVYVVPLESRSGTGLVLSEAPDCSSLADTCMPLGSTLQFQPVPSVVRVSNSQYPAEQSEFRLVVRATGSWPTNNGTPDCLVAPPPPDIVLGVQSSGALAGDLTGSGDSFSGEIIPCRPPGTGEEVFYGVDVPDGVGLRVAVVAPATPLRVYIVDDCQAATPTCLGRSLNAVGTNVDVAEMVNNTGATRRVHVVVEGPAQPTGSTPFQLYWNTY